MKDLNKDSIVQGDNGSVLRFTITGRDLTGAIIKVNIRRAGELFTKNATVIDLAKGICEVVLNREDLKVAGVYFLQPTITYADNSEFFSELYRFAVRGNLSYLPSQPGNGGNNSLLSRLGISVNGKLTIDGVEQIGGGSEEMPLVVKDYFEGSANVTKTYTDSMIGFEISNDATSGGATLTFTINGLTIPVKAGEVYSGNFAPYKTVVINSAVPYRTAVLSTFSGTVTPPVADITAPTVTIAPNGGTFATSQQVTLSANETATIYYTLNGTTPTVSSTVYSAPITLSATTTLKYFAKDTAGNSSAVQSATFTKDVSAPADTTPPNDVTNLTYTNLTQTGVRLTWTASNSSDVSSYEIFNGANNIGSTTGAFFDISGLTAGTNYTFTVKAKDGATNISTGASVNVTTTAAPPSDTTAPTVTASPVGGTFTSTQTVTLSANETATIYYTTDGTDPKTSGSKLTYSVPIVISSNTTIKYYGVDSSSNESTVTTQNYTINVDTTPKALSMNGTSDYIKAPSLTFDEIQMDVAPEFVANKTEYYFDGRVGGTVYHLNDTSGNDSVMGATVYVDGFKINNTGTSYITSNNRVTIKSILATAITDDVNIFASSTNLDFMKGKIYKVSFYNAGVLQASYDFTKQFSGSAIPDSSGNGNIATLNGGTWINDIPPVKSTATPYYVSLDGVSNKIVVPIPANVKHLELKLSRESNDTSGYIADLRTGSAGNAVYSSSSANSGYNAISVDGVSKTISNANATTDLPNGVVSTIKYTLTTLTKSANMTIGAHNSSVATVDFMTLKVYGIKFYDSSNNVLDSFDFTTGTGTTLYGTSGMNGSIKGGTWTVA